jgi:hypothetical protein
VQKGQERSERKKSEKDHFLPAAPETEKVNPRISLFKELYEAWYKKQQNGTSPQWTGHEGKLLKEFLESHPDLSPDDFQCILDNRALGHCNVAKELAGWIRHATDWLHGPADDFGNVPRKGWVNRNEVVSEYARESGLFEPGGLLDRGVTIEGELGNGNGRAALPAPPAGPQSDSGYSQAAICQRAAPRVSAAPGPGIVANGRDDADPTSFPFGRNEPMTAAD